MLNNRWIFIPAAGGGNDNQLYNFIVGQNGGLLEGFGNDQDLSTEDLDLSTYYIVGISNTGDDYCVYFRHVNFENYVVKTKNIFRLESPTLQTSLSNYHGGSFINDYPQIYVANLDTPTTTNNLPFNLYDTTPQGSAISNGPSEGNNIAVGGYITGGIHFGNYFITAASEIVPNAIEPWWDRAPGNVAGYGDGTKNPSGDGEYINMEGVAYPIWRVPIQDGFTASANGTKTYTQLGEYGTEIHRSSTINSSSSGKNSHTYTWFGTQALIGQRFSHNYTWTSSKDEKYVNKYVLNTHTPNGIIQTEYFGTEHYIADYTETAFGESDWRRSIVSEPPTNPPTVIAVGGHTDVYTGGGNNLTWNYADDFVDNLDLSYSVNYSVSYTREVEKPIFINNELTIYAKENIVRNSGGNTTAGDSDGGGGYFTSTSTSTDAYIYRNLFGYVQGTNCCVAIYQDTTRTEYQKTDVDCPFFASAWPGTYLKSPTGEITTNRGWNNPQKHRTHTVSTTYSTDGCVNVGDYDSNRMEIYINDQLYVRRQHEAKLSLCFLAQSYSSMALAARHRSGDTLNVGEILSLKNSNDFYYNLIFVNLSGSTATFDKDLVMSAGHTYTDFYPYNGQGYTYMNNFSEWVPATGTVSPYNFTKIDNPHWLGNYNGIAVDIFIQISTNVYAKYSGTLQIDYEDINQTIYNNTYTATRINSNPNQGFSVVIDSEPETVYFGVSRFRANHPYDQVCVVTKDDYTSYVGAVCYEHHSFYNYNLYTVKDEEGNDTVELALSSAVFKNANFADAVEIVGQNVSVAGAVFSNLSEINEPPIGNGPNNSVWYKWVAPSSNPITIHTLGSGDYVDTILAVYTGNELINLVTVAINDDAAYSYPDREETGIGYIDSPKEYLSAVQFTPVQGETYYIQVNGGWGSWPEFVLSITDQGWQNIPAISSISSFVGKADIYRFNTQALKWQRRPNAIGPISMLTARSEYVSYHPVAQS